MGTCKECGGELIFRHVSGALIPIHLSGGCHGHVNRSSVAFVAEAASSRHWTIATLDKPVTYQTQCWRCGATVFYHTNGNNDHVLFDRIGWPWEIHSCWSEHVGDQRRGLREIEHRLNLAEYDGRNYHVSNQQWGTVEGDEISGIGFVTDINIAPAPITISDEPDSMPCCETVLKRDEYYYRLLFPFRYARFLRNYSIVKFRAKRFLINELVYLWDPDLAVMSYPSGEVSTLASTHAKHSSEREIQPSEVKRDKCDQRIEGEMEGSECRIECPTCSATLKDHPTESKPIDPLSAPSLVKRPENGPLWRRSATIETVEKRAEELPSTSGDEPPIWLGRITPK